ncbi:MAG: aldehyde dehydrogenase family protein, partial [Acidobacteriaceae bacterium]|nr:aldehyde dehydrogenase family protein [Acidobacteriaceae bacterium]
MGAELFLAEIKLREVVMPVVSDVSTRRAKLLVNGEWVQGRSTFPVFDKYSGDLIGEADAASESQVRSAIDSARTSFETAKLDPYKRYEILMRAAQLIEDSRSEFVELIIAEAGFPSSDANNEVTRAVQTFTTSAEEGKRLCGEIVPIDGSPGNA